MTAKVRLDEVLSTYPGDVGLNSPWRQKSLAIHGRFLADEQPQALMIGLARAVEGRRLLTAAGAIDCASDIAMMPSARGDAGPPFLFMLAGVVDPAFDRILPSRAFAQPIVGIDHLVPVEGDVERRLFGAAMAFGRSARHRFPSVRIALAKPLFDIETGCGLVRPPLLLTVSNARTEREERFVVRSGRPNREGIDRLDDLLGRTLTIPDEVLAGGPSTQAAWFVDAIYGMPRLASTPPAASRSSHHHAPRAS